MRRSTFCEEEPIVPLHKKLKLQTVYAVYEFEYNAKSFAIDTLATDTASTLLRNAKYFSILDITKKNGIVTISLAGQEPPHEESYGSFVRDYPVQHHTFKWILQRKDTKKHDDSSYI